MISFIALLVDFLSQQTTTAELSSSISPHGQPPARAGSMAVRAKR
jgi:hypothetical protein